MKNIINAVLYTALTFIIFPDVAFSQHGKKEVITDKAELLKLKNAVEKNMDSLNFHLNYIAGMGLENPELEKQYTNWMAKYAKNAMIPYAIAKGFLNREDPKARPYLLKAVEIDPKFADAWGGLWTDGERWGDFKLSKTYLQRAAEADPSNPNYAFYYASSTKGDEAKHAKLSLDVAKRFPNHDRGAQALYWLAAETKDVEDKIKYFELLKNSYNPQKFAWSGIGMTQYFELLLAKQPQNALALAEGMAKNETGDRKQWPAMAARAKVVAEAKELMQQKKAEQALALLKTLKLSRGSGFAEDLLLMKVQAEDLSGRTNAAYDSLVFAFAKTPKVLFKNMIEQYGGKLGKGKKEIQADILKRLNEMAKPATPFNGLKRYLTSGEASLSDYKGKVILLTYWFPGCGPCRAEFPHFENVVRKFNGKDLAYLGINIVSEQNDYVVPFMKSSGYSFTPLEEQEGRVKGNLDNRGAAPVNFLIDQDGKLYFSNFRTDRDNQEDLELMINLLLDKDK